MATKTTKGRITGLIGLTVEAQVALEEGDPVHVTGPYEVGLADGTKPVLGLVSVANKAPTRGTATRDPLVPGDVTVEAMGFYVMTVEAALAIAAGAGVSVDPTGYVPTGTAGAGDRVGIALTAATAAGQFIDVLFR